MDFKTLNTPLFIAQPATPTSITVSIGYPLSIFYRYEISFLQQLFNVPLYPDRTNGDLENTRAQVRYIVLPVVDALGFGLSKKQEHYAPQQKRVKVSTHYQRTRRRRTRPAVQALILATKRHVKFELPGTRTPNCPIKSRELYH